MSFHDVFSEWVRWGWLGLANHLWQATLFAAFAAIASALLGRGPARARSAVWLVASAKFALPLALFAYLGGLAGIGAVTRPASPEQNGGASAVWAFVEPVGPAAGSVTEGAEGVAVPYGALYGALTAVWLAGAVASSGYWLVRRRRLSRAIRAGRPLGLGREAAALGRARSRLGVAQEVGIIVSPEIHEPGVWRVRRPVLVLPEGVADQLSDDELEAVMMHEVAHVARRDNLVGNLQMALCCVFWFHPVVWAIDRKLLAERERACDEAVIGAGGGARVYAAGLLKVFRFAMGWKPAGVSCATGSHLGRRIEQIMNTSDRISTNWHRAVTAAVVLGMAGLSASAMAFGQGDKREVRDVIIQKADGPPGAELAEAAAAAPTVRVVQYENAAGAPLFIGDAQIKKVPAEKIAAATAGRRVFVQKIDGDVPPRAAGADEGAPVRMRFPETDADGNALVLLMSLTNTSGRAIEGYQMGGGSDDERFFFEFHRPIAPGATFQMAIPVGERLANADAFVLSVMGVRFDGGETWGDFKDHGDVMIRRSAQ
jgi:beta-lactamase regulating signal transducer with metallopeptidase domain